MLPGRVQAQQITQIRPQVSGIVQKQLFREGTTVKAGQALYQLEPPCCKPPWPVPRPPRTAKHWPVGIERSH
ncbi:MAG: biotin/lipoyl-binding protein [Acidovorax sp.]|nr:biotin/lipoyl-binding protein [Acidovorax sp.]